MHLNVFIFFTCFTKSMKIYSMKLNVLVLIINMTDDIKLLES